jgi:hypothetical protein
MASMPKHHLSATISQIPDHNPLISTAGGEQGLAVWVPLHFEDLLGVPFEGEERGLKVAEV